MVSYVSWTLEIQVHAKIQMLFFILCAFCPGSKDFVLTDNLFVFCVNFIAFMIIKERNGEQKSMFHFYTESFIFELSVMFIFKYFVTFINK
jgi:hypothetical protein